MSDDDQSASKPASLLTKTQRSRISNEFADQAEHQRRRDQQQIRERIRAGVTDFELLASYPDRQFELAFDDLTDEEVTEALANARLVTERLRVVRDVDREDVVSRASVRARSVAHDSEDTASLEDIELVPAAEYRQQGRAAATAEHTNVWDRRADGLLKTAAVAALPLLLGWFVDTVTTQNLLATRTEVALVMFLSALVVITGIAGVLLIKGAQALKHDIVPGTRRFRRDPVGTLGGLATVLRRPGAKLRAIWDEL